MACLYVGVDGGSTLFGILFDAIGTRATFLAFATTIAMLLAVLLMYLRFSEHAHEYENLPFDDTDSNDTAVSGKYE